MKSYIYQAVIERDEEGAWCVSVPDLPGCYTDGDTFGEAIENAADAMKTYVASLLSHGEVPPSPTWRDECVAGGARTVAVFFETDAGYAIEGECVSAAEASRELGVSASRVTKMIDAGLLDAYRDGRRTYVSTESIKRRLKECPGPGRPRKQAEKALEQA